MSGSIDTHGDIEIICSKNATGRIGATVDDVSVGDRVFLLFGSDDAQPPYTLKISSPSGASIVDTIVRDLPTGGPHSPPPIEFIVSIRGTYRIEIKELKGRQKGEATLAIT
jgi:hypothetical protein